MTLSTRPSTAALLPRSGVAALLIATLASGAAWAQDPDVSSPPDAAVEHTEPLAEQAASLPTLARSDVQRFDEEGENITLPPGLSRHAAMATGRTVTIESTTSDVFVAAETVHFTGEAQDNFFGAGQLVQLDGLVGGDVFAVGETIEILNDVHGDIFTGGASIVVAEGVTVYGDVYSASGELRIDGDILGDLVLAAADAQLHGEVGGDVYATVDALTLGPGAVVQGDLHYTSTEEADLGANGAVMGTTTWSAEDPWDDDWGQEEASSAGGSVLWGAFGFAAALLVSSALMLLFPRVYLGSTATMRDAPAPSLGTGVALLFGVPALALFLTLFIVPIPLNLLAMGALVLGTFIARDVAAFAFGTFVLERFGQPSSPWMTLMVGLLALHLVYALPFLGAVSMFLATLFGLGAMFLTGRAAGVATS